LTRNHAPGEETEFGRVRVQQLFHLNGDVCQRIDRARDRLGPYNAVVLNGDGSPRRIHVLDHEIVEIIG
jgi:hypothetical protein